MTRPLWMVLQQAKHGYTNKCAGCKWFDYDPAHKDENGKMLKGDGWCVNKGKARFFTVGKTELERNGRERKEWGGTCFYFEPTEDEPKNAQFVFDLKGGITMEMEQ